MRAALALVVFLGSGLPQPACAHASDELPSRSTASESEGAWSMARATADPVVTVVARVRRLRVEEREALAPISSIEAPMGTWLRSVPSRRWRRLPRMMLDAGPG